MERLQRHLTGDLDAVILRAMRKEPQHRYVSVDQFAADIVRHLNYEPVNARQGNWLYYGQRFARRNAIGVTAGSAFLIFVVGIAVVMSIQRQQIASALQRATQQGQRAETVSEFMLDVFGAADPYIHFGKEPTASALLDQAALRIDTDLGQQPLVRARLLEAIGRSYRNMRQAARAIPFLEESLELQRQTDSEEPRIASVLSELSMAQREAGRIEDSDRTLEEAIRLISASPATQSETYASLLVQLGRLEMVRSNTSEAEKQLSTALSLMSRLKGRNDLEVAGILLELASVHMWQNDLREAEKTARRATEIYAHVPDGHPDRVTADSLLAQILLYENRTTEASRLFERVLAAQRQIYGPKNAPAAETLGYLAQVRHIQGDFAGAEKLLGEALDIHRNAENSAAHKVGYLQTMLGAVLLKQSRYADAETCLKGTLDMFSRALPADHQYVASAEYYLGEALLGGGKFNDAEAVLTASMNRWKRSDGPAFRVARSKNALGEALVSQGRTKEGEQYLIETFRELIADESADKEAKDRALSRLERFYVDRGQRAKFDLLMQEQSARVAGNR
jgi:lipopolysaccharide biosynthesis regulator YciM